MRQLILEADLIYCPSGIRSRSQTVAASLTSETFTWQEGNHSQTLNLSDILNVSPSPAKEAVEFIVTACPLRRRHQWTQVRRRVIETYTFSCSEDLRSQWLSAFSQLLRTPAKHLVVILNTTSGQRRGLQLFERVRPLLEASQIQVTVAESKNGSQTRQLIQSLNLAEFDGLVVVGGDGTVHDVINGLMQRSDAATAIQTPIGVIPAGTGNGLCQSLLAQAGEPYDVMSAGFAIAKGHPQPLDILQVQQDGQLSYGILSLAWGLISDSDLASDRLRWLGPLRDDICALLLIARLRAYPGRLVFEHEGRKQTIEDEFIAVWGMNVPWAASNMFVAPNAERAGGKLDLLMVRRGASRWRLLQAFSQLDTGGHVQFAEVDCFKTSRLTLTPEKRCGTLAIDGEPVSYGKTEMTVLPILSYFFALTRSDSVFGPRN
ncbi:Diacylglycerol kinase [Acaryochloris thomasi RCC1774]|uniref:Diacylglycerol kinase n=1 Tax=Acaryochloris thomasi RCC1774 TaxID=1764569 RepID=A0A2W1JCU7_9CYAN|nr:Diacylglycerol kinase [Acaryochloris thomasi RCC1774]